MEDKKDTVYSKPRAKVGEFSFDGQVADVFENMIQRSVPGYSLLLEMIGMLTEKYAQPGTNCYDLGCSLGASTLKIRQHLPADCTVIGVDNSEAMIDRARQNMQRDHSQAAVNIRLEDLEDTIIENASIVVMNFTLQFIADEKRQAILARIAKGLNKGGILILAEKIKFEDEARQQLMTDLHVKFKAYQGYSDLEIAQKRTSLENVLVPNTMDQHIQRLEDAGYANAELCVRCLNFAAFLAIK